MSTQELVREIFKGFLGLALLAAATWLAYLGKISDQLAGAVYGAAAAYTFHLGSNIVPAIRNNRNNTTPPAKGTG